MGATGAYGTKGKKGVQVGIIELRKYVLIVVVGYLGIMYKCRGTDLGYCIFR